MSSYTDETDLFIRSCCFEWESYGANQEFGSVSERKREKSTKVEMKNTNKNEGKLPKTMTFQYLLALIRLLINDLNVGDDYSLDWEELQIQNSSKT